jgi:flagellar motor switch protein FliM
MSDTLTAEELADIVVTAKRAQRGHGRRARRVRVLDFSRPMKLSPPELRRFENAHARFSRDAAVRLSSELHSSIELEVTDVVQLTWSAAVREVRSPAILAVALSEPAGGDMLICVEEPLLLVMIERLLGGAPTEVPAPRNLTEIDMAIAHRAIGALVETLSAAWQEFLGLRLSLTSVEPQHANVELVPPSEPTVAITIEARDQTGAWTISLVVPYPAIAAATTRLAGKSQGGEDPSPEREDESETMRNAIGTIGVELRAEVGAIELTLGEVLGVSVGDVLALGPAGTEGLFGGGERLHRVRPGRSGSRRAVQIIGDEDAR